MYLAQRNRTVPPTAEMIKVADQALVRIRLADGHIVKRVIVGSNPLSISFRGQLLQLFDIAWPSGQGHPPANRSPAMKFFIGSSRPLTSDAAEALSRMLQKRTDCLLQVVIEDGWWFATDSDYPTYNRFIPYQEPPSLEEFKKHTRFYCDEGEPYCLQLGPARD